MVLMLDVVEAILDIEGRDDRTLIVVWWPASSSMRLHDVQDLLADRGGDEGQIVGP
jgi:hypothetical protein